MCLAGRMIMFAVKILSLDQVLGTDTGKIWLDSIRKFETWVETCLVNKGNFGPLSTNLMKCSTDKRRDLFMRKSPTK